MTATTTLMRRISLTTEMTVSGHEPTADPNCAGRSTPLHDGDASPGSTFSRMKWFIGLGMLVWPGWASVAGAARWTDAAGAAGAVLLLGLVFGWKFPQDVATMALAGIAGGAAGVLIGLFYGVVWGYWVGAAMSVGFIVACLGVVAFCRTRTDRGLIRGF